MRRKIDSPPARPPVAVLDGDESRVTIRFVWGRGALDSIVREAIQKALATACGDYAEAAKLLGIGRRTLERKIARLALDRSRLTDD